MTPTQPHHHDHNTTASNTDGVTMNDKAFQILFKPDDIVEIRALHRGGPRRQSWWVATDLSSQNVKDHIKGLERQGYDIYFGANPRNCNGGGDAKDVSTMRCLFTDLDPKIKTETISWDDASIQVLESGLPRPSVVVSSGRGWHLYWVLNDPITDREVWRTAQKSIISKFDLSDEYIHDAPRIMRFPGTRNSKNGNVSKVTVADNVAYPLSAFLRPVVVVATPRPTASQADTSASSRFLRYLEKTDPAQEGKRNSECYRLACVGHDMDLDVPAILDGMRVWNAAKAQPPLDEAELLKTVTSAKATARSVAGSKNREFPGRSGAPAGSALPIPIRADPRPDSPPAPVPQADGSVLDQLARDCSLVVGTTQVWHNGLRMSMPMEALIALHPVEGKIWRMAKDRRTVRAGDIVFETDPAKVKPGQVNLWQGLELVPDSRPCPMLSEHIDILCGRNAELAAWVRAWLAIQVQRPGVKLDTALIVQGKPGSGKSIFFSCFRSIFGRHGIKATQSTIDSDYTGWMSQRLFVQCEEVGSTRGQVARLRNVLKDWVTGEQVEIREKYQVSRTETAHCNFVFLSNDSVPLPIDADDRRFAVVRHDFIPDRDYFVQLGQEIEDNGPARLLWHLLQVDLGEFWEHSPPPHTSAKDDLTDLCKTSPQLFLSEWMGSKIEGLPFISASGSDLYLAYAAWAKLHNYKVEAAITFHKRLKLDSGIKRDRTANTRYYRVDYDDCQRFESSLKAYLSMVDTRRVR